MSARCLTRRLKFLLTPLREGRPSRRPTCNTSTAYFYSRPCGRGDKYALVTHSHVIAISTHAPAGGATTVTPFWLRWLSLFLLTPLREGRPLAGEQFRAAKYFYSRPCGRGDVFATGIKRHHQLFLLTPLREGRLCGGHASGGHHAISTHAPAGGATRQRGKQRDARRISTHAPAGGATEAPPDPDEQLQDFYSRPCGRGDPEIVGAEFVRLKVFLLTPLREGRPSQGGLVARLDRYFYSRPCGRGDRKLPALVFALVDFYSRPCGRGDPASSGWKHRARTDFYSRPCGRGDDYQVRFVGDDYLISTHAPAGGATVLL